MDIRVNYEDYGLTLDDLNRMLALNLEQIDLNVAALAEVRTLKVQEIMQQRLPSGPVAL